MNLEKILALISVLLLILCMLAPLKQQNRHRNIRGSGTSQDFTQDTYCTRSSSMCTYGRAYCSVDYYVTWLSPHARPGSSRMEQRVHRFRFASSALRAFSLGSPMPRQVFNVSVVAFATCTYRLQPHGATRTSIPLRFIRSARFLTRLADASPSVQCVGRGFRHMHVPAPAAWSNAYLDSASLHPLCALSH